jgi:hypothetical protein
VGANWIENKTASIERMLAVLFIVLLLKTIATAKIIVRVSARNEAVSSPGRGLLRREEHLLAKTASLVAVENRAM